MKKLITVLVIVALLLTLAPATIVYAGSGGVTGSGKGGNTAPTVDGVWLVETGDDTAVTGMSPLAEYRVKASLGDINTIGDIQDVEIHVYHTSDGGQTSSTKWDADQCGVFKWNKDTGLWTMENNGGAAITTWVLGTCTAPSVFTGTTGDWYLGFIPGELALQDDVQNWHAWVRVDDENKNGTGSTVTGASMGAYNEISTDVGSVIFGTGAGIEPGQTGYIETPGTHLITTQVASNAVYDLGVKSDATWDDGGTNTVTLSGTTGTPVTSGQFSLEIDDQQTAAGDGIPKTSQAVTSTNVTITLHGGDGPTTTVDNASEGTLPTTIYMALSFAVDGITEVTYSGIITFTVTN